MTMAPPLINSGYPPSCSNIGSSAESRYDLESNELPKRQSLPSISETISPTPINLLPSAYFSSFPVCHRRYDEKGHRSSPWPLRTASSSSLKQQQVSHFTSWPRTSFNDRPGRPPVFEQRPSPSSRTMWAYQHELPKSQTDSHALERGDSRQLPPTSSSAALHQTSQLPHGQLPLPTYPALPQHSLSYGDVQNEQQVRQGQVEGGEPGREVPRYNTTPPWGPYYGVFLAKLSQSSQTILHFAETYDRIAKEQNGGCPIPRRLPTEQEVDAMLSKADFIQNALEHMREVARQSIRTEHAREPPTGKLGEARWAKIESGTMAQCGITQGEQRRRRAAWPGKRRRCN